MSLPYSPSRAVYQGNGAATSFPFAFKIWSADQLAVSITSPEGVSSQAQGWTASLSECGGSVTYLHEGKPLPTGWRLAIMRAMPFSQTIDLVSASRFDPQVIEDGLDQAAAERQELNEKIARAVILPATSDQSPEEIVATVYASRDAAATSANTAEAAATAAASSAATAEQSVQTATAAAVNTATTQAANATASATAAQASADAAAAASGGMAPRMDAVEAKNTEQDARLDTAEAGVAAITTTLIGSVISMLAAEDYVPNGCVPADGAEYTRAQFPGFFDDYLTASTPRLLTCTYAAFAAQTALTGNCAKFAVDADNQKFKVPLLKDGDSITQASSAAELGKSYKAGLPNITGNDAMYGDINGTPSTTSALYTVPKSGGYTGSGGTRSETYIDASRCNAIYGNSTTVTDEQVRLRHFVVVASAQNNASVFDWSNYMAGLAGKANADLNNVPALPQPLVKNALNAPGDAPIYACRAWVTFNMQTGDILASGNVSSITDGGTGRFQINFIEPMPDENFVVTGKAIITTVGGASVRFLTLGSSSASWYGRSSSMVKVMASDSTTNPLDCDLVHVAIFR